MRLKILLALVPKVTCVAFLVNPSNAVNTLVLKNVQAAAQRVGVKTQPVEASTLGEIANTFDVMARQSAGALSVQQDPLFVQQKSQIVEHAAKHRLPSIGSYCEYVEAGGLMGYGQNIGENFRRAATYIDKISKGANPATCPSNSRPSSSWSSTSIPRRHSA
jgi:putative tryptophan/tyrosine transport system substrate-binding protein